MSSEPIQVVGTVQHYAWGDPTFIPELLHVTADGRPWAELWLGTHPNGPTTLADGTALSDRTGELPYLLKVLAAVAPLSLQVHPTVEQARDGFARGIYPDSRAKPELLVILGDRGELAAIDLTSGRVQPLATTVAANLKQQPTTSNLRMEVDNRMWTDLVMSPDGQSLVGIKDFCTARFRRTETALVIEEFGRWVGGRIEKSPDEKYFAILRCKGVDAPSTSPFMVYIFRMQSLNEPLMKFGIEQIVDFAFDPAAGLIYAGTGSSMLEVRTTGGVVRYKAPVSEGACQGSLAPTGRVGELAVSGNGLLRLYQITEAP
mgnify:CR=1 FL=1